MRNLLLLLFIGLFLVAPLHAQQWNYLHRDSCDIQRYTQTFLSAGIQVTGYSTWEHAFATNIHQQDFPFVQEQRKMGVYHPNKQNGTFGSFRYGRGDWQLAMLGLDSFHKLGYTGKGVTIALMDAGFYRVDSLTAFDSLRKNGQIKGTFDVVSGDSSVYEDDAHGMAVLSTIAGNIPDSMIGAAPDANFLLIRTEDAGTETHKEEFYWIKGMEIAHQMGADIIHSSLGYSLFDTLEGDYTYFDMDGKSTFITRATDSAFLKGMFVCNSAGNSGDRPWKYITAPCDGKYVLCVGAVDSFEQKAGFSSFGPSADGRVKPEVMALGRSTTIVGSDGWVRTGNGTSFSGPIIAGFVACLKQAHPNAENYRIYQAIIQSADRYQNPDSAYGYGIPNILKADSILKRMASVNLKKKSSLKLYPNPGEDEITLFGNMQEASLFWTALDGRVINADYKNGHANELLISTASLSPGTYFLYVEQKHHTDVLKWVKVGE